MTYAYGHAKRLAVLVGALSSACCTHPCKVVAANAVALDQSCVKAVEHNGDGRLAAACGLAYETVRQALSTGQCSAEVGKR
jgi:hypothetical protein